MSKGKLAKISSLRPEVVLRPHQELAVDKVLSSGRGLIAHPVGSGKTLTAIAAIEKLRERGKADKTLVVLPASLKSNFIRDGVQRFTDSHAVDGVDGVSPYQVVSIDRLRNDPQGVFRDSKADTIVFDEIHRAKDSGSKTHTAVQSLSDRSKNFIGLTGSLVSNHPREVVPLLNLVHPGHTLPKTTSSFSKKYTEQKSRKTPGVWGVFEKGTMKTHVRESTRPELGDRMRTFVDYVPMEAMSGDIPRMEIKDVHVPMTTEQTKQYNFALGRLTPWQRGRIRRGLPVNQTEAKKMLAMLTKARQASNALHIHKEMPLEVSAEKTPKVRRILDDVEKHLRENKDGQAVIYSNFVQGGADAAVAGLKNRGYDVGVFAGVGALGNTVSVESRQKAVDDFKAGKKRVIVMTPAGTEGVSLNNATAFFEMDRHYNPERNNQAIARGRRMGGLSHRPAEERKLEVYRYYSDPQSSLRLFGGQAKGVDEWIGNVAKEKDRLNQELRDSIVKKASVVEADMQKLRLRHLSSDLHPILTPLSYDRLQEVRGPKYPMKERMRTEEKYRKLLQDADPKTSFVYATIGGRHAMEPAAEYPGYTHYADIPQDQLDKLIFHVIHAKGATRPSVGKKALEKSLKDWERVKQKGWDSPKEYKDGWVLRPRIEVVSGVPLTVRSYVPQQEDRKNKDAEIVMAKQPTLVEKMGQAALGGAAGKASRFLTHGIPLPGHMRGPGLMDILGRGSLPFGGGIDRYLQNAAVESKLLRGRQGNRTTRQLAEAMGVRGRDGGRLMQNLKEELPSRPIAHTLGALTASPTLRGLGSGTMGAALGARGGLESGERLTEDNAGRVLRRAAVGAAAGGLLGVGHGALQARIHNRALAERLQQAVRTGNTNPLGAQELRLLKNLQAAKAKL